MYTYHMGYQDWSLMFSVMEVYLQHKQLSPKANKESIQFIGVGTLLIAYLR